MPKKVNKCGVGDNAGSDKIVVNLVEIRYFTIKECLLSSFPNQKIKSWEKDKNWGNVEIF